MINGIGIFLRKYASLKIWGSAQNIKNMYSETNLQFSLSIIYRSSKQTIILNLLYSERFMSLMGMDNEFITD